MTPERSKSSESFQLLFRMIFLIVTVLLLVKGMNSFISSSEFWSIYLSQKIISFDSSWKSVYLKPLFHLVLSGLFLAELNDYFHIYTAKILFSLNGIGQFFLIFRILEHYLKNRFLNLLLTIFLFCAPFYLANFERIRSDQLALTFFLLFFYLFGLQFKHRNLVLLLIACLFPFIALKHAYFSLLCLYFLPLKESYNTFVSLSRARQVILVLVLLNIALWGLSEAVPAFVYFAESYRSYSDTIYIVRAWIKSEWFYIYFSFFPYVFRDYRIYIKEKGLSFFFFVQLSILFFILIHPQKFHFFLASLLPILYLNALFFTQYLKLKKVLSFSIAVPVLILVSFYSLYLGRKHFHLMTSNAPQLVTIERISNIITANNLIYLDGMAILPRAKNIGCFVSPDDVVSNQLCMRLISDKLPDAIILTNRLLSLGFDFSSLENGDYIAVGPNLFIKKSISLDLKNTITDWPPPSILFSYEQYY